MLSIIIPVKNKKNLSWQRENLKQQSHQPNEIIEVYDVNRAKARNNGAGLANGNILLFMDNDILLENDYIEKGLSKLDDFLISKAKGFIAKDIIDMGMEYTFEHFKQKIKRKATSDYIFNGRWETFHSDVFFITSELFNKVGGFDEFYKGWGFEDTDFGYRLNKITRLKTYNYMNFYHLQHPIDVIKNYYSAKRNGEYFFKKFDLGEIPFLKDEFNINGCNKRMQKAVEEIEKLRSLGNKKVGIFKDSFETINWYKKYA